MTSATAPDHLVATRDSLHRAAEHLLAAARKRSTGEITLVPAPGGVRTPPLADGTVVELDGGDVVVRGPAGDRRAPLTTLAGTAEALGIEAGFPWSKHPPGTEFDPDAPLPVDREAAAALAHWFALGQEALDALAAELPAEDPTPATGLPRALRPRPDRRAGQLRLLAGRRGGARAVRLRRTPRHPRGGPVLERALRRLPDVARGDHGGRGARLLPRRTDRPRMSEQGWLAFLAAEDLDDWVVLHGGATAAFRVASLAEAARLADAVAQVPGLEGSGALLTVADERLTVRLTRGVFRLEAEHVALARAVSAVARAHGAAADRAAVQEVQVAVAATARRPGRRLLACGPGLRTPGRGQRRRPARSRLDGLDAGAGPGQAAPARDARRRVPRSRAGRGAGGGGARRGRPRRRRHRRAGELGPRRPGRQPGVRRRVARRLRRARRCPSADVWLSPLARCRRPRRWWSP